MHFVMDMQEISQCSDRKMYIYLKKDVDALEHLEANISEARTTHGYAYNGT